MLKGKKANPKRLWEPKPKDSYHMWCYCLVNMKKPSGEKVAAQQPNFTLVDTAWYSVAHNTARTSYLGCKDYSGKESAIKKGFYDC